MNFGQSFFLAMLLKISSRFCIGSDSTCGKVDIYLVASPNIQTVVSSDFTLNKMGPFTCNWIIQSSNSSHVIKFQMVKMFTKASVLCGSDYVIVRDGTSIFGRPLRIWCKNNHINETVTSYSSSIHVQFVTSSNDLGDLMFIMSYWEAPQGQVVVGPVEYGITNYILIVLSAIVGGGLLCGAIYLYYREVKIQRERKKTTFKQKLGVRRQGISGASGVINDNFKMEELSSPEETSFSFLSPTPTSLLNV